MQRDQNPPHRKLCWHHKLCHLLIPATDHRLRIFVSPSTTSHLCGQCHQCHSRLPRPLHPRFLASGSSQKGPVQETGCLGLKHWSVQTCLIRWQHEVLLTTETKESESSKHISNFTCHLYNFYNGSTEENLRIVSLKHQHSASRAYRLEEAGFSNER